MEILAARYEGGELILKTNAIEAKKIPYQFKPGNYEIIREKKRRSLDANAYCWKLATDIANAVGITKEDVYRRNIREVGEYTPLPIKTEAVEAFLRVWQGKGIGWFAEVVDDSKLDGYKLIFAYHGSSVYDTSAMSRLIESLIQDAKAVGVDTLSEREKSLLLEDWACRQEEQKRLRYQKR